MVETTEVTMNDGQQLERIAETLERVEMLMTAMIMSNPEAREWFNSYYLAKQTQLKHEGGTVGPDMEMPRSKGPRWSFQR
jgi:hypothetical protein